MVVLAVAVVQVRLEQMEPQRLQVMVVMVLFLILGGQ